MRKTGLHFLAAMALVLTAWTAAAQAADPLCDNALWTQMVQRGRLQGQVDLTKAENLIYKADSILQYTCFNRFMDVSKANMSYYFTPFFVDNVIKPTVDNWIGNNFNHSPMGGRLPAGVNFAGASGSNYTCDMMAKVWAQAKCLDVSDILPQDNLTGVFEFTISPDSRALPTSCAAPSSAAFGVAPVAIPGPPVQIGGIALLPTCGTPIPTGRIVDLSSVDNAADPTVPVIAGNKYNEKTCPNPACTYVPTGVNAGNCVVP